MKTIRLILIIYIFTACVPANEFFFTQYRVLKGTHYSIPQAACPPIPQDYITFQFKTNETWDFDYEGNFGSKIAGIYWLYPHQCSVRIGLLTDKDGSEWLWYYIYDVVAPEGRFMGKIAPLKMNYTYEVTLGLKAGNWFIYVDGNEVEIPTEFKPSFEPRGFDSPYYGGEPTAPHTWIVPIKIIL